MPGCNDFGWLNEHKEFINRRVRAQPHVAGSPRARRRGFRARCHMSGFYSISFQVL